MCGRRATRLLVDGCRSGPRARVLLPALFCVEVAAALEAAGLDYRCYDLPADLSGASREIERSIGDDIGSVVILHPFGLSRPPLRLQTPRGTLIVEDACHALRTSILDPRIGAAAGLTVYSFRKELSWMEGGLARGPAVAALRPRTPGSRSIARRWHELDALRVARTGRLATRAAVERLASRLPRVTDREVLTALPVKSRRRDGCIERLRRKGIQAWRWRGRLKGSGPSSTPHAWRLTRELLLVPLPASGEAGLVLDSLAGEPLEDW